MQTMKNLKALLRQQIEWEFKKNKIFLKSNQAILVELIEEKGTRASCKLDDDHYTIRNKDFWNHKNHHREKWHTILNT